MKRILRKSMGWLLVLAIILAMIPAVAPVKAQAAAPSAADVMQDGVTLHAWNWSFSNIEKNMAKIASLGYTSIQVPPIQQAKQTTAGYSMSDWWVYYQPAAFRIDNTGNSALGTKAQFESMCEAAHEYGLYVIVDVVANHMADNGSNKIHSAVISDLRNDSSCWHDISQSISNYNDRYNITQYCLDGVPDLNTSSKKVQNYVLNYLKECVDAGADGFRFDAVKHIETPDDTWCASDFWPTVINGIKQYDPDVYLYGELLYHPDDANSISDKIYTKYFSVTDNSWSNAVRNNVVCGQNAGSFSYSYHKDAEADQLVLWAESHDTYAGNDNSDSVSIQNINKTWALVAARADAMSLYLARPQNMYPQKLGEVTPGGWDAPEVAAVNKFHNAFAGQSEYVSNQNNIAYVERGNSGVVLVNCGGTSCSVNVTANAMANGTYKDQITGNTFTVSGGRITGQIGSTGIAVVYNVATCAHASHGSNGRCTACNEFVGHRYVGGTCACGAKEPTGLDYYLIGYINGEDHGDGDDYANLGDYSFKNGPITVTFTETSYVCVKDASNTTWYMTDGWQGEVTSVKLYKSGDLTTTADKLMIPGGTAVTISLAENADGTLTLSYTTGGSTPDIPDIPDVPDVPDVPTHQTVYFDNTAGWGTVNIYYWSSAQSAMISWPGEAMTKVEGRIYSCELPQDAEFVIFNNGADQTDDLTLPVGKNLYSYATGEWSAYTPPQPIVLYFQNTAGWSSPYIYAWSDSGEQLGTWPGKAMAPVAGVAGLYSYTLSSSSQNVIFHNNEGAQTADLTIPTDGKNLYTHNTASWSVYQTCQHKTHDAQGICTGCGKNVGHSWVSGGCDGCGGQQVAITRQPVSVTVASGKNAAVSFTATGDGLTYQWYYKNKGASGFTLTKTFSGNSYTTPMNATRNGRQIYCVVTDQYGNSVQTDVVTISMAVLSITRQPVSVSVASGRTATVSFTATGDGLTYKWYYKNKGASSFTRTTTFSGNTYTAQMNASRDGRQIYCVVTDKYGNSVKTDVVTISMKKVAITQQPVSVTVAGGQTATVSFAATGDGLTYKWYYKNKGAGSFVLTKTFSGNTYTAQMNASRDGRQIYCVVTDKYGNSVKTDVVTLSMKSSLTITKQPVSVTVANGQTATISFTATGEGLTYKWYYKNKGASSFALTKTFTGNTYTAVMNASRSGRQIYCVVTDKYGSSVRTETVTLTMHTPLTIIKQPADVTAAAGKQAKVTVTAQGDGLKYAWYFADKGSDSFTLTTTFRSNIYNVPMNTARDGRRVYCVITDAYGNTVTTDIVTISMK